MQKSVQPNVNEQGAAQGAPGPQRQRRPGELPRGPLGSLTALANQSPRLQRQFRIAEALQHSERVQSQLALAAEMQAGPPVQRFTDDRLIAERIAKMNLPKDGFWGHAMVTKGVADLVGLLRTFQLFDDQTLTFVIYMRSLEKLGPLNEAIGRLRNIEAKTADLISMLGGASGGSDGKGGYGPLLAELQKVLTLSQTDISTMIADFTSSGDEITQTLAAAFGPAGPVINSANFMRAERAGVLRLKMIKWWSSAGFPGHNAEVMISMATPDGRRYDWAIAHVKWKDKSSIKESEPFMSTFKAANGDSIYGGNIDGGSSVVTYLLGEIIKYPPPAGAYTNAPV